MALGKLAPAALTRLQQDLQQLIGLLQVKDAETPQALQEDI